MIGIFDWRKALVLTHRWLGIGGGVLVVLWFASGIVMMYARMPALESAERLARLPELDLSLVRVSPAEAAGTAAASGSGFRLVMLGDRPVYRFGSSAVFADSGELLARLGRNEAVDLAARFAPGHLDSIEYDTYLTGPDQWTLQSRALLPMHRIALGDPADTRLYFSERSGEAVMKTTRSGRRWAYAGAVLHWLYFTPFRVHSALWAQTIIWLSILGCVLTLSGLVWGVSRFSWRRRTGSARSPYGGLLYWHHYAGLLFGFFSFTWMLSGGLSMDPWSWHPGTAPTRAQRAALTGGPPELAVLTPEHIRTGAHGLARERPLKELSFLQFGGEPYLEAGGRLVSAMEPGRGAFDRFDDATVVEAARRAMPGVAVEEEAWLSEYDNYYYSKDGAAPLPVLRIRYADPQRTWLYFDPRSGAVVRKEERLTRLNRWLYHGFHSLDFPFLYTSRPLWDIVVIVLSLGGLALAATTLQPGWVRLMRHVRRVRH